MDGRLRETGSFKITRPDAGQERSVRTPETENRVLLRFADTPSTSTRSVAAELGIRHEMVWKVMRAENMHPFHLQKVQLLCDDVHPHRVEFVRWMPHRMMHSFQPEFYYQMKPAVRDKACSTCTGRICGRPESPHHCLVERATQVLVLTSGQGFSEIICWDCTFCPNASMAQSTLFSYSMLSRICCREYRPLCARTCGSCMMVHHGA
ncbi:hypothetical protein AVEN_36199-1 [Araneus ventricosus]|uniref:Uncharacterized protein n=1 Tax=Araneus ventricosus TaxID=182803 RepID=A0A4Y2SPF3_ARAVE|nr:hypothetical protein AVEN_36199-1 [Araneus ventricosus]